MKIMAKISKRSKLLHLFYFTLFLKLDVVVELFSDLSCIYYSYHSLFHKALFSDRNSNKKIDSGEKSHWKSVPEKLNLQGQASQPDTLSLS